MNNIIEDYRPDGSGRNYAGSKGIDVDIIGSLESEQQVFDKIALHVASTWGIDRFHEDRTSPIQVSNDQAKAITVRGLSKDIFLGAALESIHVSFCVRNASRSLAQQITRCRLAGYGHEGTRDTNLENFDACIPSTILQQPQLKSTYEHILSQSRLFIKACNEAGIPFQDSSMIAPLSLVGDIVVHTNLRVIFESFAIRLTNQSKWEISHVFNALQMKLAKAWPTIGLWFVAPCEFAGHCIAKGTLFPPCGKMPLREGQSMEKNHFGNQYKFGSGLNPLAQEDRVKRQRNNADIKKSRREALLEWAKGIHIG